MAYYGIRKWLKAIREEKHMSQHLVSALAGISQALYSNIECGFFDPNYETAKRIANVLDFPVERFAEEEEKARIEHDKKQD